VRRQAYLPDWAIQSIPPVVTMLVSGIWHGVGWTYLVWGSLYGVLIAVYQLLGMRGEWRPSSKIKIVLAWLVMFSLTVLLFLLFAAPSLGWIANIFSNPFLGTVEEQSVALLMFSLVTVYSVPLVAKLLIDRYFKSDSIILSVYYAVATLVMFVYINSGSPDFIYFQF
jgi:alginate O-acetyltransferase complex protein AlgI